MWRWYVVYSLKYNSLPPFYSASVLYAYLLYVLPNHRLATKMFPKDLGLDIKHLMSIKVDPQHRTALGFPYDDAQEMEEKFEEITSTDEGAMLHLRYTNEQIGFRTRVCRMIGTPDRLWLIPPYKLHLRYTDEQMGFRTMGT